MAWFKLDYKLLSSTEWFWGQFEEITFKKRKREKGGSKCLISMETR